VFAGDRFLTAFRRPVGFHWAPRIPLLPPWCQRTPLHYRVSDNVYGPATRSCPHTRSSKPDRTRHEFTVPIFLHVFTLRFASVRRRSQPNSFYYFWINPTTTTTTVKMVSICFFTVLFNVQTIFPSTSILCASFLHCRPSLVGGHQQEHKSGILGFSTLFRASVVIWHLFTEHISWFIIVEEKRLGGKTKQFLDSSALLYLVISNQ